MLIKITEELHVAKPKNQFSGFISLAPWEGLATVHHCFPVLYLGLSTARPLAFLSTFPAATSQTPPLTPLPLPFSYMPAGPRALSLPSFHLCLQFFP